MGQPGRLVRRRGLPGAILYVWEPPVPFVPPSLLGSSVFLYGSESDARKGTHWGGSGFLLGVSVPSEVGPAWVHLYAVTNDHVRRTAPVVRLTRRNGTVEVVDGLSEHWTEHPASDDVAIRPLGLLPERSYWYVEHDALLRPLDLDAGADGFGHVGPGDDCLMVGRYINGKQQQLNQPVARFGNLAMLPEVVRQSLRAHDQESFLVDMRSKPGFSGSPVFVYYASSGSRHKGIHPEQTFVDDYDRATLAKLSGVITRAWLLGIDWGSLPLKEKVIDEDTGQKVGDVGVNSGMAAVVPAWKLADLLKEFAMARKAAEKALDAEAEGEAVMDAANPKPADEFERFQDLTRKLVNVPKTEIDAKRKES